MNVNDGGPAFPTFSAISHCDEGGMTLRDYFAAKAMAELIRVNDSHWSMTAITAQAYNYADAMLRARGAQ